MQLDKKKHLNKLAKKSFFAICLAIVFITSVQATAKITATLDKTEISFGEVASVSFALTDKNLKNFNFPRKTNDYQVVASSTSSNFQIINGVTSQNRTYKFVIQPLHPGNINIPPGKANIGANTFQSEALSLKVLNSKPHAPQRMHNSAHPATQAPARDQQNIIARLELSKTNPYVNEQITMRMKVYHRGNLRRLNIPPIQLDNFIQRRDDKAKEYTEVYEGLEYYVYEADFILFPVKAGPITIPSYEVQGAVIVDAPMRNARFDPFRLMNPFFREKEIILKSNSVQLNVRELPSPAPKDFSGYVGDIAVNHEISKLNIISSEASTIKSKIYGSGNPGNVSLDFFKESKLYHAYQDNHNTNEEFNNSKMYFQTNSSTAIFPEKSEGRISIELKPIISFNPISGEYEEHGKDKFEIKVSPDPNKSKENNNTKKIKKEKSFESKEVLTSSDREMIDYKKNFIESLKLNTLIILIIICNFLFLVKLLLIRIRLLPDDREDPSNLKEGIKRIKKADSLIEISTIIKEITQKYYQIEDQEQIKEVNEFIAETDAQHYGQASSVSAEAQLENFRLRAIEILRKIKKNKEPK